MIFLKILMNFHNLMKQVCNKVNYKNNIIRVILNKNNNKRKKMKALKKYQMILMRYLMMKVIKKRIMMK